jgi:hypothetical protein
LASANGIFFYSSDIRGVQRNFDACFFDADSAGFYDFLWQTAASGGINQS